MRLNNVFLKNTGLAIGVLTLSACQPAAQPTSNMQFEAPARILQVRAVDKSRLRPSVRFSDGTDFPMQSNDGNTWSGTINVEPNKTYTITVDWIESLREGEFDETFKKELVLATWSKDVAVDADGTVENVPESEYNYSLDEDSDGFTNLAERKNDTNPFVFDVNLAGGGDDDSAGDETTAGATNDGTTTTDGTGNSDGTDIGTETDGAGTDDDTDIGTATDGAGNSDGTDIGTATDGAGNSDGTDIGTATDGAGSSDGTDIGTETDGSDGGTTAGSTETAGTTDEGDTDGDATTTGGSNSDTQTRASVLIPRILPQQAPIIDGEGVLLNGRNKLIREWENAVQVDDSGEGLWIDRLMIDKPTNNDPAVDGDKLHRWAAMHDGEYLYVLVLSDDEGRRSSDSDSIWKDDSLELFIDGDNSKLTEWGDADDYHYLIALQQQDSILANNEVLYRVGPAREPQNSPLGFIFSTGPGSGPDGIRNANSEQDVYELAIPIDNTGIIIGQSFGFELQINDDDNGDGRDSKWGWFNPSRQDGEDVDLTYLNPSIMGTLILEE